jgi:hypothetical protein
MSTSASRRHLRLIPSPARPETATREFPVRFTPASDRLAWLRRSVNGLGWLGSGTLCLEEGGVRLNGRRLTLLGLRRARRLVHPGEIRDVYREGNAVQINLRDGGPNPFLRFWTEDVADAAELVARLPTQRTIEIEALLRAPQARRGTLRHGPWLLGLAVLVLVAMAALKTAHHGVSPPPVAPPAAKWPLPAAGREAPAGELQRVVEQAADDDAFQSRMDLERFAARFDGLTMEYAAAFNALTVGNDLSQQQFVDGLQRWLSPQWATLAAELPRPGTSALRNRMQQELAGVISGWQRALTLYADGLRAQDVGTVNAAFDAMREAEDHQARVRQLLKLLEARAGT